jgi:hypothetical protein
MVVDIYFITAAGNSISSQLDSSCQGNRYGTEKAGGTARPSRTKSHLPGQPPPVTLADRCVGPALFPSASFDSTYRLEMKVNVDNSVWFFTDPYWQF